MASGDNRELGSINRLQETAPSSAARYRERAAQSLSMAATELVGKLREQLTDVAH
jgi:hypothetical protein